MQDETKKSQSRIKKEGEVESLTKSFKEANNLIFWNYSGLSVPQLQELRTQLAQTGALVSVTKNTLINLALKNSELSSQNLELAKLLEGPTAFLQTDDEAGSLKILVTFLKNAGVGSLKFGFLQNKFTNTNELEYLATLPPREAIMGQISNLLYQPVYNLLEVLQANSRNLVLILNQVPEKVKS